MKVEVRDGMAEAGRNDLQELKDLVAFLKGNGIAEFEMERPDLKVGLRFAGEAPTGATSAVSTGTAPFAGVDALQMAALWSALKGAPAPGAARAAVPETVSIAAAAAPAAPLAAEADPWAGAHIVKSPIVGTFYAIPTAAIVPVWITRNSVHP